MAKTEEPIGTMATVQDLTPREGEGLQLLVVSNDGQCIASHPLPGAGPVAIGRAEDRDIRIDHESISRAHAVLHIGPGLFIEDCGSANGSRVRGHRFEPGQKVAITVGEAITLGSVTALVQRRSKETRSWRLWGHSYFEGRLDEECARAARYDHSFALVHVQFDRARRTGDALAALEAVTSPGDVIGEYGPGQYEILLVEAECGDAEQVRRDLLARALGAGVGIACFPGDGRDPHTLCEWARMQARHVIIAGPGRGEGDDDEPAASFVTAGDEQMQALRHVSARVATTDVTVLLTGESGVGKEVFAHTLHAQSRRASKQFVAVNCAALSESLIESELFGHKKGAFTGADRNKDKIGLLEQAAGGTVFLDEIGELPLGLQPKLLRVLEERKVQRVGDTEPRPIDVRFICATNRDLRAEIARGAFREDLFYRIEQFPVEIPPLRQRMTEIEPLARHFVRRFCRAERRPEPAITAAALELLTRYHWPGNVRELRNLVQRAVIVCDGEAIEPRHLSPDKMQVLAVEPAAPATASSAPAAAPAVPVLVSDTGLTDQQRREKAETIAALEGNAGNQTRAARQLGISRRTLINRLDRYGLPRPRKDR